MAKEIAGKFAKAILTLMLQAALAGFSGPALHAQVPPGTIEIAKSPIPIQVLVQSPAETNSDLQVICLFRSSPVYTLHGSLAEINEKLKGLLDRIRKPGLFRGEVGETFLIAPPSGSLTAKNLLVIGLGDSQTFSPQRMDLVGEIAYSEAAHLGVAHPYFAPTILDGGVAKVTTGEVAEQVIGGFLRAAEIEKMVRGENASGRTSVAGLTYLAGPKNVDSTRAGIEKAIGAAGKR